MKKKSIISLLICCMTLGMVNTSCKDMLTPDSERHAYTVAQDSLYSYWGILKSLQNIAERYVILNECRGDLVDGTSYVSDTIAAIINFGLGYEDKYKDGACAYLKVSDYYHVINSCNAYIAKCDTALKVSTGQRKSYMLREYSQVQAIRAWVYMQLVYAYGKVPFYTKPLLTTSDIEAFISNPAHATVDAATLTDSLCNSEGSVRLEDIYWHLDGMFGDDKYPEYNNYGEINRDRSPFVCHSMRVMFPLDVVLGDLYLLKGDRESCKTAAKYYYKFLNTKYCGPLEINKYFSTGNVIAGEDEPQYSYYSTSDDKTDNGIPYKEKGFEFTRGRYRQEAITSIPSNKGRLDGNVFTDINRLFGFEANLSASGSGDNTSSNVNLSFLDNGYRRELIPSKGYEALCDSQKFECYIGSKAEDAYQSLVVLPGVGDARRAWIYNSEGSVKNPRSKQYNLPVGDDTQYGKLVSKQNPKGSFTTVYPMIYRKSTIWLRYAEAINRAGYPSYAFAILRNGLASYNYYWFPHSLTSYLEGEDDIDIEDIFFPYLNPYTSDYDYAVKDSAYLYRELDSIMIGDTLYYTYRAYGLPEYDKDATEEITTLEGLKTYMEEKFKNDSIAANANLEEGATPIAAKQFELEKVYFLARSFCNHPSEECPSVLWYLDRREVDKASIEAKDFLNFSSQPYLEGYQGTIQPYFKKSIYEGGGFSEAAEYYVINKVYYLTIGVHQRGCGILRPDERDFKTAYDYVDMVAKKIKENHNVDVTKEQIYGEDKDNPIDKEWIIEAVEDLIIDEDALELAFEGCRFSDLARVALRRNDPKYLAERVARRSTGDKNNPNSALYNHLSNKQNWYLPFPVE